MSKNVRNELVDVTKVYVLIALPAIVFTACFRIQVDTLEELYYRRNEFNLLLKTETSEQNTKQ